MCAYSVYVIPWGVLKTRMNPDSFRLRVDAQIFKPESNPEQKCCMRIQKYPDTCCRGVKSRLIDQFFEMKNQG